MRLSPKHLLLDQMSYNHFAASINYKIALVTTSYIGALFPQEAAKTSPITTIHFEPCKVVKFHELLEVRLY